MKKSSKNKKGISLIVLIITIVVIIILAAAIILNLSKTNIIENANEAVVKQDFKTFESELDLYIADEFVDKKGKLDVTTIDATTKEDVAAIIPSIKGSKYEEYVTIVDGKIVVSDEMPEEQKEWANEALNSTETSTNIPTEPDEPDTPIFTSTTTVATENSTFTGEDFAYNNPVIPAGFMILNDGVTWTDTDNNGVVDNWNDGLVIADASGNEFVWVPCVYVDENETDIEVVEGVVEYKKRFDEYPKYTSITSVSDDAEALANGITKETDQIKKYGGFYIGRYEAGVPANQTFIDGTYGNGSTSKSNADGIPVVQRGAKVWTNISYNKAMPNAKSFINTANVKSGLLTGTAWDTVCAWIQSETDSDGNPIHDVTNSISWGNYSNSISPAKVDGYGSKQVTGFSEEWKAKNIYDFAGNTYEWTGEAVTNSSYRFGRGGFCNIGNTSQPSSFRDHCKPSSTNDFLSFRIALYVM